MGLNIDRPRVKPVLGPSGTPLSVADLPPSSRRWVISRKAIVLAAVRGGLISIDEVCSRYVLALDEYIGWESSIDEYGFAGLRTTRIQQYRASRQSHIDPLIRALQETREMYDKSERLEKTLETIDRRIRTALDGLHSEIEMLQRYAARPNFAGSVGLVRDALETRQKNLVRSLDTVHVRLLESHVETQEKGLQMAAALAAYESAFGKEQAADD